RSDAEDVNGVRISEILPISNKGKIGSSHYFEGLSISCRRPMVWSRCHGLQKVVIRRTPTPAAMLRMSLAFVQGQFAGFYLSGEEVCISLGKLAIPPGARGGVGGHQMSRESQVVRAPSALAANGSCQNDRKLSVACGR